MSEDKLDCACPNCTCGVHSANQVEKDGKKYCSSACAEGHPNGPACCGNGCNCG